MIRIGTSICGPVHAALVIASTLCMASAAQDIPITIAGKVLDGGGTGLAKVTVTIALSDGTQKTATTEEDGSYKFGMLNAPGRSLRIEFYKTGIGFREYDSVSERASQELTIVLGAMPNSYAAITKRQAEIETLLLRAKYSPKDLSKSANAFVTSPLLKNEIAQLHKVNVTMPDDGRAALKSRSNDLAYLSSGTKLWPNESPLFAHLDKAPMPSLKPTYGSVKLATGFLPDSVSRNIGAGGPIEIEVDGVKAWVAKAPDFLLYYTAGSRELTISAKSDFDTVLLVNLPDGKWLANHFNPKPGLNPLLKFARPQSGRYDIWVATVEKGKTGSARLIITEQK